MPANLETQQWPQDWKRSVFILISKKGNAKECSHCCTIVLISYASKVMLKIPQARLQQFMNWWYLDARAGFRKGRGTRSQTANIHWIIEKASAFQKKKKKKSVSLTILKPLTMWITKYYGKFLWRWEYQCILRSSWETCVQDKKQQLEPDIKQQTGSKLGKKYVKKVYCHLVYLIYMQSTLYKTQDWMKQGWHQDCHEQCQ